MKRNLYTNGVHRWRSALLRLVLCACLAATALGGLAQPAQAAGIYTHTWFVDWAIDEVKARDAANPSHDSDLVDILNRHLDDVHYGAIFVDIGMTAGWPDDTTHDGSFQSAISGCAASLIGKSPRSEWDEELIAFYFGILAHNEADWPWHDKANGLEGKLPFPWDELGIDYLLRGYDFNSGVTRSVNFDNQIKIISALLCARGANLKYVDDDSKFLNVNTLYSVDWGQIIGIGSAYVFGNGEIYGLVENHAVGGLIDGAGHIADKWMKVWYNVVDQAPPLAQPTQTLIWGQNGADIYWNWTDDKAGIDPTNCPTSSHSNVEGVVTASCTDRIGKTGQATYLVDWTPPQAAPTQSALRHVYGRRNPDVTVTWDWSDAGTGVDAANCTTSSVSTGKGTLTASCIDLRGNAGTASFSVVLDVFGRLKELDTTPRYVQLNWKVSTVDLFTLLGIDSSYANRKALAIELGCPLGYMHYSEKMNTWLHQKVLEIFAEHGGTVPPEHLGGE